MKNLSITAAVCASAFMLSQTKLENVYKAEIGIQGISIGAELPFAKNMLADVNVGWGGVNNFDNNGLSYSWSGGNNNSGFLRGQLRYYLNRERREAKGHSLKNNAGIFLAYQTKFMFSRDSYHFYKSPSNWLNEIQFGQQLPLGKHFIFRYQAGVGLATKTDYHTSRFYPALGFAFGYCL